MEGKAALIIGAVDGLGRAFVEILLEQGANVCIFDLQMQNGLNAEKDLQRRYTSSKVFFFHGNATSEENVKDAIKMTIDRFGSLDILCNNAGIANERDWEKNVELNLMSVIRNSLLGLRHMGKATGRPEGVIVNVASVAGVLPSPQMPIYSSTKHGVVGFSRALGTISPRLYDIRVNCLCPSFVDTPMLHMTLEEHPEMIFDGQRHLSESMRNSRPKIGVMRPRDVAEVFLRVVRDGSLSGEVMLITPEAKGPMQLGKRMEDAIAMCKM